jgi:hypothetical protein
MPPSSQAIRSPAIPGRFNHHIFAKSHVEEILNLQPKGGRAKPYQVRQIREVLLKYNLRLED